MTEGDLKEFLEGFGLPAQSPQQDFLIRYYRLLLQWGSRINLTGSTEWSRLKPLFEEALWAGALYPASAQRHLDIGSGAGFPALIIRILRSGAHLDLVEARGKRAAFLETVLAELQLSGVVVHNLRLEEFLRKSSAEGRWSIVSWKGVRLNGRELSLIRARALPATQLWLFHGRRLPVESPATFLRFVRLVERFRCPYRESSYVSVFEFVGAALCGRPCGQE